MSHSATKPVFTRRRRRPRHVLRRARPRRHRSHRQARRPPRRSRRAGRRRGRHHGRGLAPLDEGAPPAARRGAGRRAGRGAGHPRHRQPGGRRERAQADPPMAAEHGAAASCCRPTTATCASSTARSSHAAGHMPVLAYHYPGVSAPGITHGGAQGAQGRRHQGLHRRRRAMLDEWPRGTRAGSTRAVATIVAYAGQLGCTGAILAAANLEPELCADAFAGNVPAQKDLLHAHKIVSPRRREGHQGGAGPQVRHLAPPAGSTRRADRGRSPTAGRGHARGSGQRPRNASRPTVRPGARPIRLTASSTPGMNDVRS